MKNQDVAKVFNEIAEMLEIKGDNPFRIRAYRRAAQNIEGLADDISGMKEEELKGIPGIGRDLADKIKEYTTTGSLQFLEDLKREVPPGLLEMLSVPGLGPKTARMLFDKLKVSSIDALEGLAKKGGLRGLPGIKARTEENLLKGIELIKRRSDRFPIGRVLPVAEDLLKKLRENAPVKDISLAGSLRRWKDTIKDIDIIAASNNAAKVMRAFTHLPDVKEVIMSGQTKSSIITREGIQVDLRVVEEDSFGSALAYFTGSKEHNVRLRELAVKKGLKINEYGVFDLKTGKKIGGKKETDIYGSLGLDFIPPELREDSGEINESLEKRLPDLVNLKDIKGDLHVHSKYSDGSHTIEELIDEAKKRGYQYIAITDHSKGLGIARGLSIEQLLEQSKQIKSINNRLRNFMVLSGAEVDIRSDGAIDYPDEVLKKLDIVVASIHSGFRQPKEQITMRLVSAMKNPHVSIIAHPTGRLIGEREAYEIDFDEFLTVAKHTGTAVEINAYPLRLDLSDIYTRKAKGMGIRLAVSTDTHVMNQFDFMRYGVGIARRGWLEKEDLLNTYDYKALLKLLRSKLIRAGIAGGGNDRKSAL
ncbi:MAG: DNA polymerase/3'-5' exonuclease PolX [Nitrospirae bacterium]|nr:DNA polymerase/3'-5' exonuclease PolX [Nitrospirota bacterium]